MTVFESVEQFKEVQKIISQKVRKIELKTIRKRKKNFFEQNTGVLKLSTIHIFKGLESPTVILLLLSNDDNDELIYTALTRCQSNLFILSLGNEHYDEFFKSEIST